MAAVAIWNDDCIVSVQRRCKLSGWEDTRKRIMRRDNLVSVNEAAEVIGCTVGRVRQLLIAGRLEGEKLNERAWRVDRRSAEKYARDMAHTGRPRSRPAKIYKKKG